MNKNTISSKPVLMIATMLPAMMLATLLTMSLVPTEVFAQEDNAESVTIDPIVQPSVDVDYNVDVNTHVITDEEDCDEASDEVSQENNQDSNQEARSDGSVGDNGIYVSPQIQTSTLVGGNLYIDTDVVPEGCIPNDRVNQENNQGVSQDAGGEVEAGGDSITNVQTHQRADTISRNDNVNTDATIPVSLPQ